MTQETVVEKKDRGDIQFIRKDLNILERGKKCELRKTIKIDQLERKHQNRKKKLNTVVEVLKQKLLAKAAKIKIYEQRKVLLKQNWLFE